jgi:hypothetical protein
MSFELLVWTQRACVAIGIARGRHEEALFSGGGRGWSSGSER